MNLTVVLVAALLLWAALAAIMSGAWVVQQRTRNSGFVDAVWTFGLGAVGVVSALVPLEGSGTPSGRQLLVALLVGAWSLRLGGHILGRSTARSDDPRYAALIRQWGDGARRQMFILLQKQAIVTVPLALGLFLAAHNPAPLFRLLDYAAIAVVMIGLIGESISDRQLAAWARSKEKNEVICDRGLWRWSRHPNYFFEWMFWVAVPLLAIAGFYPWGWLALAAPLCIYWLLVYVSGIPPLEEHMVQKYGAAYRSYQARTSAFFPWPPRSAP
jgi:steroid 5-alpha reductase family enzyme